MNLEEQILSDIKTAMKSKDSMTLNTVRTIKSQMKYYQIEKKLDTLSDEDILSVINKMCKQRRDSIEQYTKANRMDLVETEQNELNVLIKYLPAQLSKCEIEDIVKQAVAQCGATEKKQMGLVMKIVMPLVKGKADGKLVNQVVNQYLS